MRCYSDIDGSGIDGVEEHKGECEFRGVSYIHVTVLSSIFETMGLKADYFDASSICSGT